MSAVTKPIGSNRGIRRRKSIAGLPTAPLHLMLLPSVVLIAIYSYVPMLGMVIAFQNYNMNIGLGLSAFWKSEFVGLENFRRIFADPDFAQALANTVRIAVLKMTTMFFIPITFALLLNEVRNSTVKRSVQTLIYMPHFLSWIILAGIIRDILGNDGIVNNFLALVGLEPRFWLGQNGPFLVMLIVTNIWKDLGFDTIIYLAAITSVDPTLYEAAMIDGAGRLRQTWHVTLPGMRPIIVLTAALSLGSVLNAGFDQIYNLYSVPVYQVADVIDTLVFRKGFQNGDYQLGTAIGLFNSVVSSTLIVTSYWLAKRYANYEIF